MKDLNIFNNQLIERAFDQKSTNYWKAYVSHWGKELDEFYENFYEAHSNYSNAKTESELDLCFGILKNISDRYRSYISILAEVTTSLGSFYDKNGIPAAIKQLDRYIYSSILGLENSGVNPVGYSLEQLSVETQVKVFDI